MNDFCPECENSRYVDVTRRIICPPPCQGGKIVTYTIYGKETRTCHICEGNGCFYRTSKERCKKCQNWLERLIPLPY